MTEHPGWDADTSSTGNSEATNQVQFGKPDRSLRVEVYALVFLTIALVKVER
jgi:hypothetical protein